MQDQDINAEWLAGIEASAADDLPAADIPIDFSEASRPISEAAQRVMAEAEAAKLKNAHVPGIKGKMLGRQDSFRISPFDINVRPDFNGRDFTLQENRKHVEQLARSIAQHGVQMDIVCYVEDGKLWLTDGECRLRGALYAINVLNAEVASVPVKTEPRGSNDASRILGQLVRNSGKPFTVLEKANVLRKLIALGWSAQRISTEVGNLTPQQVNRLLGIAALPEAMQQAVAEGKVGQVAATKLVRTHGSKATEVVQQAIAGNTTKGKHAGKASASALAAVGAAKLSLRQELGDLFASAEVTEDRPRRRTVITMGPTKWKRVAELLKLER